MADFDTRCKDKYERTFTNAVLYDKPFFRKLEQLKKIDLKGKQIKWEVIKADMADQVEWATENDRLTPQSVDTTETAAMDHKYARLPLLMGRKEYRMTRGMTWTDTNFVDQKVEEGQQGFRIAMNKAIWEYDGLGASVSNEQLIGIRSALGQDVTYAGLARSGTGTRKYFQSASITGAFTDQATARRATYDNFGKAVAAATLYAGEKGVPTDQMMCLVGGDIYRSLKSQCMSQVTYRGETSLLKFGVEGFTIDGVEVMWEKSWDVLGATSSTYSASVTLTNCFGLFNMRTWRFSFAEGEAFTWGGWVDQEQHIGGVAKMLNLLRVRSALYCVNPALNLWNTNWSA